MKIIKQRALALATLAVVGATVGTITAPAAHADAKTWKKATLGAGAVTAYGLLKHNGKATTLGAIATAGSYLKYRHDKKQEHRRAARHQHHRHSYSRR